MMISRRSLLLGAPAVVAYANIMRVNPFPVADPYPYLATVIYCPFGIVPTAEAIKSGSGVTMRNVLVEPLIYRWYA